MAAPRQSRSWGNDKHRPDMVMTQPRLTIRCEGQRVLVVGAGEPAPVLFSKAVDPRATVILDGRTFNTLNGLSADRAGANEGLPFAQAVERFPCTNHRRGHEIDAAKLRDQLDRVAPRRVMNVDVGSVAPSTQAGDSLL